MATPQTDNGQGLLQIGVVAQRAEVSADTIRYYERMGLLAPARRSPGGYRLFPPSVTERLRFIRRSQALGLSLEKAGRLLDLADAGASPCRQVEEALERRLHELDRRLAELRALRRSLVIALKREGGSGGGAGICRIILPTEPTVEETS